MTGPFAPHFDELPPSLPIFPLTGALLLPRGVLPLNIFEPRYLAMVDDALSGNRLIGMVQPTDAAAGHSPQGDPPIYRTGCAGRITSFDETEDGRYLITLTGLCRFRVTGESASNGGFRRADVDWSAFAGDYEQSPVALDRRRLTAALRAYFSQHEISADWEAIEETTDERLVTSLSMICPFDPTEKQALLEAPTMDERADMMISLVEMAIHSPNGDAPARH